MSDDDFDFEALLRYSFAGGPLTRLRVNIMSAGRVVKGVVITRALLSQLAARANVLTVSAADYGAVGFARDLQVDGDDLWADVVLGPDTPPFERAAAAFVVGGEHGPMILGVYLTTLSREDILRLNTRRSE